MHQPSGPPPPVGVEVVGEGLVGIASHLGAIGTVVHSDTGAYTCILMHTYAYLCTRMYAYACISGHPHI